MANPKTPITELDFDSIKGQLKTYLQTQTQFKDYNFEGSNMSAMLDVLAFNTFQNNFYTNMTMNEMFLDSAVLKNSIVSHAKELNYIPRSRKSAKATVRVTITDATATASTLTIPTYTNFSSSYQGESFNFVTNQTYIARRSAPGIYVADNVDIFEGQILASFQREGFIIDGDGVLRVQLTNDEVDTDSIVVFVDAEQQEDRNVFSRANTIYGVKPSDKVFYLEPYLDNRYAVYFGKNEFGLQPEEFEDVRVRYRVCSGALANGANSFTSSFIDGATINVTSIAAAAGGVERESTESIRYFAPKSLAVQERAVTTKDYEILLQQAFPEIKSVSAYGGEELEPPQFGRVGISVYLDAETTLISSTLANTYITYLKEKSPLGIEPIFVQTKFIFADVVADIVYSNKTTQKSSAELESLVRAQIQTYADTNLEDFNVKIRKSKLTSDIDAIDTGIQSSTLTVKPMIDWVPTLNIKSAPSFKFEMELIKPYPFRDANGFKDYKPAVKSTPFDVNKICVYLQDDGLGNLMTIIDDATNPQVSNPNVGSVDYTTGLIKLNDLIVEAFDGSSIKVMISSKKSDIVSPKGRVFIIRDTDVQVNMALEEIPGVSTTASSSAIGSLITPASNSTASNY
ncbi:MAG: hypothetical protein ACKVJK_03115 [Methylophagaceae bacterium]|jgi:hypothetical protein|tara:strand:+ start:23671 stop:25554 length:1884 start_codon:yes stop_codon:yes gene_type:complete